MSDFSLYSEILQWFVLVLIIIGMFMILRQFGEVYLKEANSISRDGIAIGENIPKFKVPSIKGKNTLHREDILKKPTLISFISPSCSACKDMLPDWNKVSYEYKSKYNFVLISTGRKDDNEKMLEKYTIDTDLFYDEEMQMFRDFKARVTPFAFMLNEKGEVVEKGLINGKDHMLHYLKTSGDEFDGSDLKSKMKKGVS